MEDEELSRTNHQGISEIIDQIPTKPMLPTLEKVEDSNMMWKRTREKGL